MKSSISTDEVLQSDTAPVLRVEKSLAGQTWTRRPDWDSLTSDRIRLATGCHPIVANILSGRGVSAEAAPNLFDPKLRSLMPDPSSMMDVDKAAELLVEVARKQIPTAIIGDYDVDGAASSALLARWMRAFSVPVQIHIPDRITEGYGPNRPAIDALIAEGARFLVTADCGATSTDALNYAKAQGLSVLVLDHHQMNGPGPDVDGLVNPNRPDDTSGLSYLCAAGVCFMVLVAANRRLRDLGGLEPPDLMRLLDLVALATIADVVPLLDLNRAFVRQGLTVSRARNNAGLSALVDVASLKGPLRDRHFGFVLGPRINAGGRIGDAAMGARLLATDAHEEAVVLAAELDALNAQRQAIEAEAVEAAIGQVDRAGRNTSVIIVRDADWHPGVVGLIAARVKERFGRPTFALTQDMDGNWVGSARSLSGVDIGAAVHALVSQGLAHKGGGHKMAAGVTIPPSQFEEAVSFLETYLASAVAEQTARLIAPVDAVLTANAASLSLIDQLEQIAPFGPGFPEPQFAFPSHHIRYANLVGSGHIKMRVSDGEGAAVDAIAFRAAETDLGKALLAAKGGAPLHLLATLERNTWQGRDQPQLRIIDAARPA